MGDDPGFPEHVASRVAIIGMGVRFPGAADTTQLWRNLEQGVQSFTRLTDEQLRSAGVSEEDIADPDYIRVRPLLDEMEYFDAKYFGYSARQAQITDPQQRLFLEVCSTALQDAGYAAGNGGRDIGVYGASGPAEYHWKNVFRNQRVLDAVGDLGVDISNHGDYVALRVAYSLGLTGPALSIATACSGSLVATHLAAQALLNRECGMAIAGGSHVVLPYHHGRTWTENGMFARDGRIRAFDADAGGTNFGTGAGAVVLKRYADALADGDHIYAVLLASAVNNDGGAKTGFSAPSEEGQRAVISQALTASGVAPDTIDYVEAHGTGTRVGDPIEVAALSAAYRQAGAVGEHACPIGSVKTNIGHLGSVAGIAGLIKTVLAMRNGLVPGSLNFVTPNPEIDFAETPFYVNAELAPWRTGGTPKRAAVSSFGIGGGNAHVILEEAPPAVPGDPGRTWQILPLSAKTESALATMRTELAAHLRAHPELELADVAHTLQVGRAQLERRDAVVCRDVDDAIAQLDDAMPVPPDTRGTASVAFLFPGQGAQHVGMAEQGYRTEPVFRETVDECAELLAPHLGCDVRDVMFGERGRDADDTAKADRLRRTELAQPALFTIEYALARLWMSWGVEPATMAGHSVGEYVAACLAGVFTLPDALELVAARGRLTQSMPAGSMVAVPMAADDLLPMLPDELDLAAVNGPRACVVAGPADAVAELTEWLDARGVRCRPLHTSHAFHSSMLDPVVEPLRDTVAEVPLKSPSIPFVSTLTGRQITDSEAVDPGYWADHLRGTVRFDAACRKLAATGAVLLEVGPGQNLTSLARQALPKAAKVVASFGRPTATGSDARSLAEAAGRLWSLGVPLDWAALRAGAGRKRVSLPVYPYERERYWVEPDPRTGDDDARSREPAGGPGYLPVWRRRPLPASGPPSRPAAGGSDTWLVFTPAEGPAEAVSGELAARGATVVRVSAGARFAKLDDHHFEIVPGHRPDYDELLKALEAGPGRPASVLHGWTSGRSLWAGQDDFSAVDEIRDTGFYSVLFLSQAWLAHWPDRPVEIRVLTSGTCNVSGAEQIDPAKSLLRGPCRVIPHESPTITCQLIDTSAADLADVEPLLTELDTPVTDRTVALRAGRRWVEEYEQTDLPDHTDVPRLLRRRGVYLITGGMGGIGLETAKALARGVAARLILVGRTPLPPRQDWEAYLTENGDDRTGARIRGIQEVERLGGEVMTAVADVADEAAMQMVVDAARERFGPVNGVFHAAGVAGGGMALVRTREQAEQVLAPKVEGTLVLDRLLGREIDVLVLYSSIVSVSGDYGMVDYCSANAFLDAYAQARPPAHCPAISVNWCGWADVGMTVDTRADAPEGFRALEAGRDPQPSHPLLGHRLPGDEIAFSSRIDPTCHWVLSDHRMNGHAVYPGVAYVELIRAAYDTAVRPGPVELRDLIFTRPLAVDGPRELRVVGRPSGPTAIDFTVVSRPADDLDAPWERHASGTADATADTQAPPRRDLAALRAQCDAAGYRPTLDDPESPVTFGPHWHVIDRVHTGHGQHLVELAIPSGLDGDLDEFVLHPALLDGATGLGLDLPDLSGDGRGFLPLAYGRVVVRAPLPARVYSHGVPRGVAIAGRDIASFDFSIMDEDGCELVAIENYSVRGIETAAVHSALGDRPTGSMIDLPATARPATAELLLAPDHGIELTWRILNGGREAQYVISTEPPAARADRIAGFAANIATAEGGQLAGTNRTRRHAPAVDIEAITDTERGLRRLWMDAFGIDQLGLDEDFIEIGGNSLVAVQLAVRIKDMLDVTVSATVVLEYPTVRTLAQFVDQSIAEQQAVLSR
ncbi:type I polyketide synthase [Actinomadura welshii]|uniref:type I polyketide synthase n=1 Tax=Actinomadura welshii TaxID=3103817 RepID=UPI00190F7973|nr:type I polyketide synthase [Actinomadura madurae]